MGLEVSGVFSDPQPLRSQETALRTPAQTLLCAQISQIDPEGRVARDGRLKVGDKIVAIDGRPISQVRKLR